MIIRFPVIPAVLSSQGDDRSGLRRYLGTRGPATGVWRPGPVAQRGFTVTPLDTKNAGFTEDAKKRFNQWNGGLTNNNCWWSNETGDGAKKNGDFNEQKLWLGNSGIHGEFMIGKLVNVLGGASLLVSDQWPIYYHYYPIGSMYGTYANIWDIWMVNVTIYSIHGSYGYWNIPHIREIWDGRCPLTNWDGDPSN